MTYEHAHQLLEQMQIRQASDLYLTVGAPPSLRINDHLVPATDATLTAEDLNRYLSQLLTDDQRSDFESAYEFNTAIRFSDDVRFRINVFRQQGYSGLVIRRIRMDIPTIEELGLPVTYGDLALMKRGLVLVAGPTGSGKSTSLAAMVGHRNRNGAGHVLTVEDPIEFIHRHDKCIITQRDVGLDTYSYAMALKNALRQQTDMVVIGEIRDREVMEQAIYFAETSHLCIATIHANNSSQVIERVLNFFPEDRHPQVLLNLSLNLRAVLSQRLVANLQGSKTLALEVMLNKGLIRQLIEEGKIRQIREMIEKGSSEGMQTFDQCLFELYKNRIIGQEIAIAESDTPANLRLQISQYDRDMGITKPRLINHMLLKPDATSGVQDF